MLKSISSSAGVWGTPLTVDSVAGATFVSIAKDSNFNLYVTYYDTGNDLLKYASLTDGTWTPNVIDSQVDASGACAIALDANNKVDIAYMSSNSHLMFVTSGGSKWALSTSRARAI